MAGAGLLAAVHRQPGDLQSVHPAGGRRGALASASPGSQPSAIGNRPAARGFSGGSGSGLRGYRRSVSRAFGARRNPSRLVSTGRQRGAIAAAGAVPGGGASGAGIAGFRAAGGGTGAPPLRGASGAVAARLAAEYRSVPNLAKRSAAGVERVLGDAARRPGRGKPLVYRHAGEAWSPGAAEGTSAPVGCRVAAGGQPCLTPASDAVAGEHSDLGRKRSFPAIPRPAGGTSSAEPVCRGHLPDTGGGGGE